MGSRDDRIGAQGDFAEAKEAGDDLARVAGRDHEQRDDHKETEDDDELHRHQAFEHRGDLAAEDQRHEGQEEDDIAEHFDEHDLRHASTQQRDLAVARKVAQDRRGQRHRGVRRHERPDVRRNRVM